MRRKARAAFLGLAALWIACLGVWVGSHVRPWAISWNVRRHWDRVGRQASPRAPWEDRAYKQAYTLMLSRGTVSLLADRVTVTTTQAVFVPGPHWSAVVWRHDENSPIVDDNYPDVITPVLASSFGSGQYDWSGRVGRWAGRSVSAPMWCPTAGVTGLLAVASSAALRSVRRARAGRCPRCGYDLRATPGRCPECGAAALASDGGAVR